MRGGVVALVGGILLLGASASGAAEYGFLTGQGLESEIRVNKMLASYIRWNGLPDVAERRFLSDMPTWDRYETVVYYFNMKKMVSFTRAFVLGAPTYDVRRFESALSDADIARLEPHASLMQQRTIRQTRVSARASGPAARAEAAADRAEHAATQVEEAADRTEAAAERTEALVARMTTRKRHS